MKINKLLELQEVIEENKTPCDLHKIYQYFSKSQEEWIDVGDMHLNHFLRVAFKYMPEDIMYARYEDDNVNIINHLNDNWRRV